MATDNPSYGYWQNVHDDSGVGPLGSLTSKSKKLGDGKFCQACEAKGFYSWRSYLMTITKDGKRQDLYEVCPNCKP